MSDEIKIEGQEETLSESVPSHQNYYVGWIRSEKWETWTACASSVDKKIVLDHIRKHYSETRYKRIIKIRLPF